MRPKIEIVSPKKFGLKNCSKNRVAQVWEKDLSCTTQLHFLVMVKTAAAVNAVDTVDAVDDGDMVTAVTVVVVVGVTQVFGDWWWFLGRPKCGAAVEFRELLRSPKPR